MAAQLQPPVSHAIMRVNKQYSAMYCIASVSWILCFMVLHPIMSTKHQSVSPAFDKKRKAITHQMKLKIVAHLLANVF